MRRIDYHLEGNSSLQLVRKGAFQDCSVASYAAITVAQQRKKWLPLESEVEDDETVPASSTRWLASLFELDLAPVRPVSSISHNYVTILPSRRELELQNMLRPEPGNMRSRYNVQQSEYLEEELAYRREMAVDADKRVTMQVCVSSGGDEDQYDEGGPYSGDRPKSWHAERTLSALQMWKLDIEIEVVLPPQADFGLMRLGPGRPAGRVAAASNEFFDSVQLWSAISGLKYNESSHFCFVDTFLNRVVNLDIVDIKYEGYNEHTGADVLESHLHIKVRPRVSAD